jgi:glycerate 2-kinase
MESSAFMTGSMTQSIWGRGVAHIMSGALSAVDPQEAVRRVFRRSGDVLIVDGHEYELDRFRRVLLVGAGKAGAPMAQAAAKALEGRLDGGLVIVKEGYGVTGGKIESLKIIEAGHPVPDVRGLEATQSIVSLITTLNEDDLVVCLISGGGSALLTMPPDGVNLDDLQQLTGLLLGCGAGIEEINTLRRHLDRVKGGGLARLAFPARVVTLILSDVIGNPLDAIASGPTAPDETTFAMAVEALRRYGLYERAPAGIRLHLEEGSKGRWAENPGVKDPLFDRVQNVVVGSNRQAAEAALERAQIEGYNTLLLTTYLQGEARQAGRLLASIVRGMALDGSPLTRPGCVVLGGETTVTLAGAGLGGRNQELALGAVRDLSGLENVGLITLATDGGDGPTDAAGAVVTGETLARGHALGLDPEDYLRTNDSYHYFAPLDDLVKTGPTRTNVNDLVFLFAF